MNINKLRNEVINKTISVLAKAKHTPKPPKPKNVLTAIVKDLDPADQMATLQFLTKRIAKKETDHA